MLELLVNLVTSEIRHRFRHRFRLLVEATSAEECQRIVEEVATEFSNEIGQLTKNDC